MDSKSIDELLRHVCGEKEDSITHQYAKIELKKREMLEQHRLNDVIANKQIRSMRSSAILGAIFVIIGAILGALLVTYLPSPGRSPNMCQSSQLQCKPNTVATTSNGNK